MLRLPLSAPPGPGSTPPRAVARSSLNLGAWPPLLVVAMAGKLFAVAAWLARMDPRVGAVLFFGPDPFLLWHLFVPSAQGLVRVHRSFHTERREIWLTIDDGPDPDDTPRILDLLDRHEARATFFVVGERAARHPELVDAIVQRGHGLAHHTQTHPAGTFWCAGPRRLARELDEPSPVLRRAGSEPGRFRSPVGIKHLLLAPALACRNLRFIGWSIRSGDCRAGSSQAMVERVRARLRPGAIVLAHEGPSVPPALRVHGLARLLEALTEAGYRCVIPEEHQLR